MSTAVSQANIRRLASEYRLSRRVSPTRPALFPYLVRKEHTMFEPMCLAVRRSRHDRRHGRSDVLHCHRPGQAGRVGRRRDWPNQFDEANLPPANVELDLSQGMFENLFGIGDAAVAGVAETLMKSTKGDHAEAMHMAAEQLAAVRQIIGLAGKVVKEVRVRAYEKNAGGPVVAVRQTTSRAASGRRSSSSAKGMKTPGCSSSIATIRSAAPSSWPAATAVRSW